jgi:hypothetical protein
MSDKRSRELSLYRKENRQFLKEHPVCQVPGCCNPSSEVHHKQGRENGLLLDKSKWMAICSPHHRYYTDNSREAIEAGISISRHKKAS